MIILWFDTNVCIVCKYEGLYIIKMSILNNIYKPLKLALVLKYVELVLVKEKFVRFVNVRILHDWPDFNHV